MDEDACAACALHSFDAAVLIQAGVNQGVFEAALTASLAAVKDSASMRRKSMQRRQSAAVDAPNDPVDGWARRAGGRRIDFACTCGD